MWVKTVKLNEFSEYTAFKVGLGELGTRSPD